MREAPAADVGGVVGLEPGVDALLSLVLTTSIANTADDVGAREPEAPDLPLDHVGHLVTALAVAVHDVPHDDL